MGISDLHRGVPELSDEEYPNALEQQLIADSRGALEPGQKRRGLAGSRQDLVRAYVTVSAAWSMEERRHGMDRAAVMDYMPSIDLLNQVRQQGVVPYDRLDATHLPAVGILAQAHFVSVDASGVRVTPAGMLYMDNLLQQAPKA
jgi:hypothetical protein